MGLTACILGEPVMLFHRGVPLAGLLECLVDQLRDVPSICRSIDGVKRCLQVDRLHTEASETPGGSLTTGEVQLVQVLRPVWICSW